MKYNTIERDRETEKTQAASSKDLGSHTRKHKPASEDSTPKESEKDVTKEVRLDAATETPSKSGGDELGKVDTGRRKSRSGTMRMRLRHWIYIVRTT